MANVLILGGTGFLGLPIVADLLWAGHSIAILSRGTVKPTFPGPVEFLQGDRRNADSLRKAVAGRNFDAVIDNLAFTPEDVRSATELFRGKISQYILTSSVVVYGRQSAKPVSEDDVDLSEVPEAANSPAFGKSTTAGKRQCELVLHDNFSNKARSYDFTVLRPAKIHGRGDPSPRLWWYIQRLNDGGPLVIADESSDPLIRHVYCDDLATAYRKVLLNPLCRNETYNIACTEIISLRHLIGIIAAVLGRQPSIVRVPSKVLQAEGILEFCDPLLPTGDLLPDITKAQQHFGWKSTPLPEWIKALCDWYLTTSVEDSWGYALRERELQIASRSAGTTLRADTA
jgi:nucleoside-diphosphate-sugar epimerase